jgi:predicted RNase H-like nuclease (RuvC/YqgF family)
VLEEVGYHYIDTPRREHARRHQGPTQQSHPAITHDIREITTDQAKWHKQGQKQADIDAEIKSRSKVEELLRERRDLQERIA